VVIKDKCVVLIHYTLTNEKGVEIDSSSGQEPLTYLHGLNQLIPGLERELTDKATGDQIKVTVKPEDGYGIVNPDLIQKVPHDAFQEIENVEPGMELQSTGPDGEIQVITVQEIDDQGVTVNGNHSLAGETLNFDVRIEAVREATPEEISHGHAH